LFSGFDVGFEWIRNRYLAGVHFLIRKSAFALLGLFCFWILAGTLFRYLPTGFLPDEDQGTILASIRLPDGASVERANAATRKIERLVSRIPGVAGTMTMGGVDFTTRTNSSNVATLVIRLEPWDERQTEDLQLQSILTRLRAAFSSIPEAAVSAFGMPPIQGLSITGGFQLMLEDRLGGSLQDFAQVADILVRAARKRPELAGVSSTFRANVPSYSIDVDLAKVQTLGIPVTATYDALQTFLGGLYVNDFNTFGRTWQVVVQAEPEFRSQPGDINRFYVRNSDGDMVPLGTVSTVKATSGPDVLYRYNRYRAIQILGGPAPGYSSGQASHAMEEVADSVLPSGYGYEWTGTTYQEKQAEGNEGLIFGFASVLVFLSLAALYESWSIPFAVLMALPLGFFGALFAAWLREYPYDIYTQIGIVTLIGLAAKNAILIVEFARARRRSGRSIRDAALEAARLRLRPILMTSFAFILGVTPLLAAKGAGGASRRSLGTAVFGGMNSATLLAIFIVPVLYAVIQRMAEGKRKTVSDNRTVAELSE
jgi:hydrophobe/amphiphile efflux-1 (HAE1) family protein